MLVPWSALDGRHLFPIQCAKGMERKRRWLVEEELRESSERYFQAYGAPLETLTSFKYLERVLTAGNEN